MRARGLFRSWMAITTPFLLIATARCLPASCAGDCDSNGEVTIDELLTGVAIVLGSAPAAACPALNTNADGSVTVDELLAAVGNALEGCPALIGEELLSSHPETGATNVPRTAWIRLEFTGPVPAAAQRSVGLACGGVARAVSVSAMTPEVLVLNPTGDLPAGTDCTVSWMRTDGHAAIPFSTAPAGPPAMVLYDRTDTRQTVPFPDDFWLQHDSTTATGVRLNVAVPSGPSDVQGIFKALLRETNRLDGFSPIAHFVVELSAAPDPTSLPQTSAESLDPLATVGLFDVDPTSPTLGRRIPFELHIRTDASVQGAVSHTLLIFPSIPLEPEGHYGLVVTRRALVSPMQPLDPSPFFRNVIGAPLDGEPAAVTRTRAVAAAVLDVIEQVATPPIPREDIALALRVSVRSTSDIPRDLLAIKEQVLAAPPPAVTVTSVEPEPADSDVAAIVTGTWEAPDWRDGLYLKRDPDGLPAAPHTRSIPFILALPRAALTGPVPVTMYQHGNPGSAEREVPSQARSYLAKAGFAVIGFTDNLNREVSGGISDQAAAEAAQVEAVFFALVQSRRIPDFWVETNAEQIAFVRAIQGLGDLDVLPAGAPDGHPDLDVQAPLTYVGISEGANHAPGLLPYAPELRAAALVAGGERLAEVLIHQQAEAFLTTLGPIFPNLTPAELWTGLALFQTIFDIQDPHNHGRFIYRDPVTVAGTTQKASILLVEGLNDSMVPNNTTESLAWTMGPIPHLQPVQRAVPFLDVATGPLVANIDAHTTAAFFQYVPLGVPGIPASPGCVVLPPRSANEGHFCAQVAAESLRQRVIFFQTALTDPAPTILDALDLLPQEGGGAFAEDPAR